MGRGNWLPYRDWSLFELRYLDLSDIFDDYYFDMSEFQDMLLERLPDSFYKVESGKCGLEYYTHYSSDNLTILRNELVCIMMDGSGYLDHMGVSVCALETEFASLGMAYVRKHGEKILGRISVPQRVYVSP